MTLDKLNRLSHLYAWQCAKDFMGITNFSLHYDSVLLGTFIIPIVQV